MSRRKPIRYDPSNDYYVVLGVLPTASTDDIRRSFRLRAKEVHPDRNPDNVEWAHRQFQRLNDAYDLLNDPELRAEYDAKRRLFTHERGPDGTAWWERPHPPAQPRAAGTAANAASAANMNSAPFAGTTTMPPRTAQPLRRKKQVQRPYQTLFVVSCMILIGSICASMTRVRVQPPDTSNGVVYEPPTLAVSTDVPVTCPSPNAMIIDPPYAGKVSGRFSIRGTANGPHFVGYQVDAHLVDYTIQTLPAPDWFPLLAGEQYIPIDNGILVQDYMTTSMIPGNYLLRLTVRQDDGTALICWWPILKTG